MTTSIRVALTDRPYEVHVGRGLLSQVDTLVAWPSSMRRILVITQEPVADHHLTTLLEALSRLDVLVDFVAVPDGEAAKNVDVLAGLWGRCAELPLGRGDVVVALGGGVVGDLAGFVAATWNRGIAVVQIPTTLLAQVDAAIGGKTGINLPTGKNLVGAFHQPLAVVADIEVLATLDARERTSGLGEIVKYGLIRDPAILDLLESDPAAALRGDVELMTELVRRSVAVKAAVVAADERESGERAHLNLGHTFGHAVEALTGYASVLHGEGVAIGMAMALRLGVAMGVTPAELVPRTEALLDALGLPRVAPPLGRAEVWNVMARDKKAQDGVRFVLLAAVGAVELHTPDRAVVDAAIDAVTATS